MLLTEEQYAEYTEARKGREPHALCTLARQLRKTAGLSLNRVEERYGIPAVVIGAYERGDREPPLRKLESILAIYGYQITAVPIGSEAVRLTGDMVSDLRAIADQLESTNGVSELSE